MKRVYGAGIYRPDSSRCFNFPSSYSKEKSNEQTFCCSFFPCRARVYARSSGSMPQICSNICRDTTDAPHIFRIASVSETSHGWRNQFKKTNTLRSLFSDNGFPNPFPPHLATRTWERCGDTGFLFSPASRKPGHPVQPSPIHPETDDGKDLVIMRIIRDTHP